MFERDGKEEPILWNGVQAAPQSQNGNDESWKDRQPAYLFANGGYIFSHL